MYINIYYIVNIKESKEGMIPNHSCVNLTSRYWENVRHWIQKLYGSKIICCFHYYIRNLHREFHLILKAF